MEIKQHLWPVARVATALAAVAAAAAALWDALRLARFALSPAVSYTLLAVAAAAAPAGVLLRLLSARRARGRNAVQLAAAGLLLLAWWLRGHPAIPADPPLVFAAFLAAVVLAACALPSRSRQNLPPS